jgi:hypothetical protein
MKTECEQTRKSFRKYLQGHLFKPEQLKIDRHLKKCAHCSSELQTLKRVAETRKYIKDITPPEGMVQKVRAGVSGLSRLRKLVYRPLWILALAAAGAAVYLYVLPSLLHDRDFDSIEAPVTPAVVQPAPTPPAAPQAATQAARPEPSKPRQSPPPSPAVNPLTVTITAENERAAMNRINSVMQGHALLRTMQFSDTVKEISGSLTAKELLTFFNRIESVGKVSYSSSRLESFPTAQPVPFVIRLKAAPATRGKPVDKSVDNPVGKAVEKPVEGPVEKPAPQPGPAQ